MSNQLTVPVKIDGRQLTAGLKIGAIENRESTRGITNAVSSEEKMRSWVAWYFMKIFILIVMSNQLPAPVTINGRKKNRRYRGSMYTPVGHARDFKCSIFNLIPS